MKLSFEIITKSQKKYLKIKKSSSGRTRARTGDSGNLNFDVIKIPRANRYTIQPLPINFLNYIDKHISEFVTSNPEYMR